MPDASCIAALTDLSTVTYQSVVIFPMNLSGCVRFPDDVNRSVQSLMFRKSEISIS